MKKKVGIITFHDAHNYGAVLQAYALQSFLEKEFDVKIINYKNETIKKQNKVVSFDLSNGKSFIKSIIHILRFGYKKVIRGYKFKRFINSNLYLTQEYQDDLALKSNYPKFDAYIAGSDQIWNTSITGSLKDAYTLNFGDNSIKRISYAASIGNSKVNEKEIEIFKNKLSKLDHISVREEDAKKSLENFIDKHISVVLDPTLLLNEEEWNKKINNFKKITKEKYILSYVVEPDDEYIKIVNYLSDKTNLKVIHFAHRNGKIKNVLKNAFVTNPFEFINLIKNAEYVICTSFHATVFSIIFKKKFFVIPHRKTGSRVINLLNRIDVNNRIVYSLDDFKNIDYNFLTDWDKVQKKLNLEREKSIKWLEDSLK